MTAAKCRLMGPFGYGRLQDVALAGQSGDLPEPVR
jgi:hypothetical protein